MLARHERSDVAGLACGVKPSREECPNDEECGEGKKSGTPRELIVIAEIDRQIVLTRIAGNDEKNTQTAHTKIPNVKATSIMSISRLRPTSAQTQSVIVTLRKRRTGDTPFPLCSRSQR